MSQKGFGSGWRVWGQASEGFEVSSLRIWGFKVQGFRLGLRGFKAHYGMRYPKTLFWYGFLGT